MQQVEQLKKTCTVYVDHLLVLFQISHVLTQSLLNYVPSVPACLTCLRANVPYVPIHLMCLRAYVPCITKCLRASNYCVPTCLKLLCAYVPLFFTCLRAFIFHMPTCLRAYIYFSGLPTFVP